MKDQEHIAASGELVAKLKELVEAATTWHRLPPRALWRWAAHETRALERAIGALPSELHGPVEPLDLEAIRPALLSVQRSCQERKATVFSIQGSYDGHAAKCPWCQLPQAWQRLVKATPARSEAPEWISVADRLPEKGLWLIYGSSETSPPTMRVDEYDNALGWTGPLEVTHWRELPLPPGHIQEAANPLPFLPPGFQLLLDKAVIDGLTSLAMSTKRDGRLMLVTISAELDTAASPYPFLEKAEADDDVVLEMHEPPNRITGTGQITEATAKGFVWSGVEVKP